MDKNLTLWVLKLKARLYLQMEYQCWKTGVKTEAQKGPSIDLKKLVKVAMLSLVEVPSPVSAKLCHQNTAHQNYCLISN